MFLAKLVNYSILDNIIQFIDFKSMAVLFFFDVVSASSAYMPQTRFFTLLVNPSG